MGNPCLTIAPKNFQTRVHSLARYRTLSTNYAPTFTHTSIFSDATTAPVVSISAEWEVKGRDKTGGTYAFVPLFRGF